MVSIIHPSTSPNQLSHPTSPPSSSSSSSSPLLSFSPPPVSLPPSPPLSAATTTTITTTTTDPDTCQTSDPSSNTADPPPLLTSSQPSNPSQLPSLSTSSPSSPVTITTPSITPSSPTLHQILDQHHQPQSTSHSDLHARISELGDQLTQLNSKLVRSFERISNLEDELHETQALNEKLTARNITLELESSQHEEALKGGLLVERANVQSELQKLSQRLILESERRSKSEASLSSINQELDDLSASLFSEANRLVANEKLQRIKAERKVIEVEEAMKRVEEVIEARRDQFNQLRLSLEAAEDERDQYRSECEYLRNQLNQHHLSDSSTTQSSNPTSSFDSLRKSLSTGSIELPSPNLLMSSNRDPGLPHSNLCSPIPRRNSLGQNLQLVPHFKPSHDILPFTEFLQFLHYLRRTRQEALTRPTQPPSLSDSYYSAAAAMSSIALAAHPSAHTMSPSPKEHVLIPTPKELLAPLLPLSQHLSQPFVKRCLDEDSEPALRLDIAPGLNFISRRAILNALLEGNLVIEPVWSESDQVFEFQTCTLCGCSLDPWTSSARGSSATSSNHPTNSGGSTNSSSSATAAVRKILRGGAWGFGTITKSKRSSGPTASVQNTEKVSTNLTLPNSGRSTPNVDEGQPLHVHTFKTVDGASTRYPICPTYCLARLRSACDFWTFVRLLQRGMLLDESFWFARYINPTTGNTRFTETHSLGLAYDHVLKRIRAQRPSIDSLNELPSPSSASPTAPTFQSKSKTDTSEVASGQSDIRSSSISETDDKSKDDRSINGVRASDSLSRDESNSRAQPIHRPRSTRVLPSSPSPSPTSTTDHGNRYEITESHPDSSDDNASLELSHRGNSVSLKRSTYHGQVPILSPAPPPVPRRSPARSLSQPFGGLSTFMFKGYRPETLLNSSVTNPSTKVSNSSSRVDGEAPTNHDRPEEGYVKHATLNDVQSSDLKGLSSTCPATSSDQQELSRGGPRDKPQSTSVELMEPGWEEKCWKQVIKLKEDMFLKRVGVSILTH